MASGQRWEVRRLRRGRSTHARIEGREARAAANARSLVELVLSLVNYAETLVTPAESEQTLRAATDALGGLGIRLELTIAA